MYKAYNPSTLFGNDMMVKLHPECDGKYIALETFVRADRTKHDGNTFEAYVRSNRTNATLKKAKIDRHGRFFINKREIVDWLRGDRKHEFMDRDIAHFLYVYDKGNGTIRFEVRWLSYYDDKSITGILQEFDMTMNECLRAFIQEQPLTKLCRDKYVPPRFDMSKATRTIQKIQEDEDGRLKRAFIKAMRDQLQWRNTTFRFYPDGGADFFFRTDDGTCGGLILSEYDGRMKYNVHT